MPRPSRIEFPGAVYFISIDTVPGVVAFGDNIDNARFLTILDNALKRYNMRLYAYVIKRDGYRIVVETSMGNMTKAMQYINSHYMAYRNSRGSSGGRVFAGRYDSVVIDKSEWLLKACRYIHQVPVIEGLVTRPEKYIWSSYGKYMNDQAGVPDVAVKEVLMKFDGFAHRKRRKFQRYVDSATMEDAVLMESHLYGQEILGSDLFKKEVRNINGKKKEQLVNYEKVIEETASFFNISESHIIENKTKPNPARNIAIYLCRSMDTASLEELGNAFGVCPSCICNTSKRVDVNVKSDDEIARAVYVIKNNLEKRGSQ